MTVNDVPTDLRFENRTQSMGLIRGLAYISNIDRSARELLVKLANEVDDLRLQVPTNQVHKDEQSAAKQWSPPLYKTPTCAVTGGIPGDGGACGDCDPCILGEPLVPEAVKRLIAEKSSIALRNGELEDENFRLREALFRCAPSHRGGHSDSGAAIADALGVSFPIKVEELEEKAKGVGLEPRDLWPWLFKMRAKEARQ